MTALKRGSQAGACAGATVGASNGALASRPGSPLGPQTPLARERCSTPLASRGMSGVVPSRGDSGQQTEPNARHAQRPGIVEALDSPGGGTGIVNADERGVTGGRDRLKSESVSIPDPSRHEGSGAGGVSQYPAGIRRPELSLSPAAYGALFSDIELTMLSTPERVRAIERERPVSAGLKRLALRVLRTGCDVCGRDSGDVRLVLPAREMLCGDCRFALEAELDVLTTSTIHVTPFNALRTRREEIWMKGRA